MYELPMIRPLIASRIENVPDFEYALQWRFRFFALRCAAADIHYINFLRQTRTARYNVIQAADHYVFSLRPAMKNGNFIHIYLLVDADRTCVAIK